MLTFKGIVTNSEPNTTGTSGVLPTGESFLDNSMALFPDEPFPDYDWAANFDFTDLDWPPNSFPGTLA